jgi:hypothetical protein
MRQLVASRNTSTQSVTLRNMDWTVIRITTEQYAQLSALAKREGRTAPAQLRALLSQSFKQAGEVEEGTAQGDGSLPSGGVGFGRSAESSVAPSSTSSRKPKLVSKSQLDQDRDAEVDIRNMVGTKKGLVVKKQRKSTCEHRIPPGSYCRVCD